MHVSTHIVTSQKSSVLPGTVHDARRLGVCNGPPLWHGAQLAGDATLVSPVTRDGRLHDGADMPPGLGRPQCSEAQTTVYVPQARPEPTLSPHRLRARSGRTLVSLSAWAIASKLEHRKVIEVLNMSQQYMATDSIGTATISDTFVTPILNVCDILLAPF